MRSKVDGRRLQDAAPVGTGTRSQAARERVSALMDGESPPGGADDAAWEALVRDPQARAAWLEYHRIGDWMRCSEHPVAFDEQAFAERLSARLRDEPAPCASAAQQGRGASRWVRLAPRAGALGASLAAALALLVMGDAGMHREFPRARLAAATSAAMASHRLPVLAPQEGGHDGPLAWVSLRMLPAGPRSQALGTAPGPMQLHALLSGLRYVQPLPRFEMPRGNPLH